MSGKQLHAEVIKLHHMIDELYDCHIPSKRASDIYLAIDEQYGKVLRELIARGVFENE